MDIKSKKTWQLHIFFIRISGKEGMTSDATDFCVANRRCSVATPVKTQCIR